MSDAIKCKLTIDTDMEMYLYMGLYFALSPFHNSQQMTFLA